MSGGHRWESAYAVQRRQRIDALLRALVTSVCGLQPEDENFQIALEFCTYHTRDGARLDVDPWEVKRAFTALEDRFGVAAQPAKQTALRELRARLEARPTTKQDAARDGVSGVLSLLLSLSGQPLRTPVDTAHVEALLTRCDAAEDRRRRMDGRPAGAGMPNRGVTPIHSRAAPDEVDSDGMDNMAPLSDGDTLSDWSTDVEEEGGALRGRLQPSANARVTAPPPSTRVNAVTAFEGDDAWMAAAHAAVAPHTLPADHHHPAAPTVLPTSASAQLGSQTTRQLCQLLPRHKAAVDAADAQKAVVTEHALVRDALAALRGWPSQFFPAAGNGRPAGAGVSLSHLSAGATASACSRIGAAVSAGALLDSFCAAAVAGDGRSVGSTTVAMARSLQRQAHAVRHDICLALEQRMDAPYTSRGDGHGTGPSSQRTVTLLDVASAADALGARLAPLARLRDAAAPVALLARCGCTPSALGGAGTDPHGMGSLRGGWQSSLAGTPQTYRSRDTGPPPSPLHPRHAPAGDAAHCVSALWTAVASATDGHLSDASPLSFQGSSRCPPSWPLRCALITFVDAMVPLLTGLHCLLTDGSLDAVPQSVGQEAPVEIGPGMACLDDDDSGATNADVSRFWEDALVSRPAGAVPTFLSDLAPRLAVAAKSTRLVRHARRALRVASSSSAQDQHGGSEAVDAAASVHESLCASFAAALAEPDRDACDWLQTALKTASLVADADADACQAAAGDVAAVQASAGVSIWGAATPPADDGLEACVTTFLAPNSAWRDKRHISRGGGGRGSSRHDLLVSWLASSTSGAALTCPPPSTVLLETCVLDELRRRCSSACAAAMTDVRSSWRLDDELDALHALFLGGCAGFASQLCQQLGTKQGAAGEQRTWHEVASAFDGALATWAPTDAALARMRGRVFVVPTLGPSGRAGPGTPAGSATTPPPPARGHTATSEAAAMAQQLQAQCPDPLAGVRVLCRVRWPLGIVVSSADCERYARSLAHLLSLRASLAICDAAAAQRRRPTSTDADGDSGLPAARYMHDSLVTEVAHILRALHSHVATRVLAPAFARLHSGLASCTDVDGARACHATFLADVQRGTWIAPDALWTLLAPQVRVIQGVAATLCGGDGREERALASAFDAARSVMLATLRGKLQAGGTTAQVVECEALLESIFGERALDRQ